MYADLSYQKQKPSVSYGYVYEFLHLSNQHRLVPKEYVTKIVCPHVYAACDLVFLAFLHMTGRQAMWKYMK